MDAVTKNDVVNALAEQENITRKLANDLIDEVWPTYYTDNEGFEVWQG